MGEMIPGSRQTRARAVDEGQRRMSLKERAMRETRKSSKGWEIIVVMAGLLLAACALSGCTQPIAIAAVDVPDPGATLHVGEKLPISIKVYLGDITPNDIQVELVSGRLNSQEQILDYKPVIANLVDEQEAQNGYFTFSGEVTCLESGRFGITARIIPKNENLPHTFRPKMITWW